MSVTVRSADLKTDRELLIDTLTRYLNPLYDARKFDWLYHENPHGEARAWIATDTSHHAVVGVAAAFPRRMYIDGHEEGGWVLGDFCINEQYRSLGPALQLQRACFEAVDTGLLPFCFDFPSARMVAVYKRLHIDAREDMLRLAKPLRVDRKLMEIVHNHALACSLSAVGNLMLTLRDSSPTPTSAAAISLHHDKCGEEFSKLDREMSSRRWVAIQRSADYLNWRYLAHPLYTCEILTARHHGALVAYAIFEQTAEDATLVDLFGIENPTVIRSLVETMVVILRKRGVITLSASILASHPWVTLLQQMGFKTRETCPIIVYGSPYFHAKYNAAKGLSWFFMSGDRDS